MADESPAPLVIAVRSAGRRAERQVLVLDDGQELTFSSETCLRMGVRAGISATPILLAGLRATDATVSAHESALSLLSFRARSAAELRSRLVRKGIDSDTADAEIARLTAAGLLDDEAFARRYVADRANLSPRGARLLRHELRTHGIEADVAAAATQGVDDLSAALALARSRARGPALASYDTFRSRVGGFLQRRGFTYGVTAEALRVTWSECSGERAPADDLFEQ